MSANCAREYVMMAGLEPEGIADIMFFKGARELRDRVDCF